MQRFIQQAGLRRRFRLLIFFPAGLLLTACAARKPAFAEWYATGIYSALSSAVNRLTGLVSFSIAELFVILFFLLILAAVLGFAAGLIRRKTGRPLFALKFFINLAAFLSIIYFLFTVTCGINYYRYPFAKTCGLKVQPSSKSELEELCTSLVSEIDRLRPGLKTDRQRIMELRQNDLHLTAREAMRAYDQMQQDYPLLRSGYSAPKLVHFSRIMSRCEITGVFFPFTMEANVNADVPEYTIPVTMCHELSHLRGYMREDEANFIGYLVCRKSNDPDFRYSGDMLAFTYASNALFSVDADSAGKIDSRLVPGARRDLAYNSEYWEQFQGPVAQASSSVNDRYLKANRQSDGVNSYGRMVDLLLAQQRAEKQKKTKRQS